LLPYSRKDTKNPRNGGEYFPGRPARPEAEASIRPSGALVCKQLKLSVLQIILGSKSAEDYQHLAEYQLLSDQ
jgi:hypothetical protein